MREDWQVPEPPKPQAAAPAATPQAVPPLAASPVDDGPFAGIDDLLTDYERKKQEETRGLVNRALELEAARTKGAELLRKHVLPHAREVAARLRKAGHRVLYQELLESYPPNVRLHFYPKVGPMDLTEPKRWTLELTWGDPEPDALVAQRWTSGGLGEMVELGSVPAAELDQLWVREQYLNFVRRALDLT
jgi:hypothetical protein